MITAIGGDIIWKFVKFGIVGGSGIFVDFGITYFGKEKLRIQKYIANAIGFLIAASTNYVFNRIWTFHSHNPEIALEYGKFFLVSLIGLAINTLTLWIIVTKAKQNFYLSKLFAIAVVTIWNFGANYFYTFV
ncbi:MAG: GtrA family protein [Bacteroidota bacterium]|nr:GtrA family protein [Bacteroidota bacterium]